MNFYRLGHSECMMVRGRAFQGMGAAQEKSWSWKCNEREGEKICRAKGSVLEFT